VPTGVTNTLGSKEEIVVPFNWNSNLDSSPPVTTIPLEEVAFIFVVAIKLSR
jgi:hypothetical protein